MKRYLLILGAVLWMGIIFGFSSRDISASLKQSDVIVKVVKDSQVLDKVAGERIPASTLVRKTAHFSIYFVLAFILYPVIKRDGSGLKGALITVLAVFLYACSDEFHQTFVKGRGAHFTDVLIDSFGGITGVLISMKLEWLLKRYTRRAKLQRELGELANR